MKCKYSEWNIGCPQDAIPCPLGVKDKKTGKVIESFCREHEPYAHTETEEFRRVIKLLGLK